MAHNVYMNSKINQSWMLQVSDIHQLYIEERGNHDGIPAVSYTHLTLPTILLV